MATMPPQAPFSDAHLCGSSTCRKGHIREYRLSPDLGYYVGCLAGNGKLAGNGRGQRPDPRTPRRNWSSLPLPEVGHLASAMVEKMHVEEGGSAKSSSSSPVMSVLIDDEGMDGGDAEDSEELVRYSPLERNYSPSELNVEDVPTEVSSKEPSPVVREKANNTSIPDGDVFARLMMPSIARLKSRRRTYSSQPISTTRLTVPKRRFSPEVRQLWSSLNETINNHNILMHRAMGSLEKGSAWCQTSWRSNKK